MLCIPRMFLLPHGERNEIFRRASESLKTLWPEARSVTEGGLCEVRGEAARGKYV